MKSINTDFTWIHLLTILSHDPLFCCLNQLLNTIVWPGSDIETLYCSVTKLWLFSPQTIRSSRERLVSAVSWSTPTSVSFCACVVLYCCSCLPDKIHHWSALILVLASHFKLMLCWCRAPVRESFQSIVNQDLYVERESSSLTLETVVG